jgi:hypothetical protein
MRAARSSTWLMMGLFPSEASTFNGKRVLAHLA